MYIVGEEKPDGKANAQANALLNGRLTSRLGRLQLKVCGEDHRVIQHRGQVGSGTHVGARRSVGRTVMPSLFSGQWQVSVTKIPERTPFGAFRLSSPPSSSAQTTSPAHLRRNK